ncbi:hypothetical protein IFM89_004266 [Coptis chinensis]|uniref:Nucleotide-diphospho-sugar transferase domain-containing protein n=1 Tax=Coptis chinensis TaxID=261450 RepID=A0A835I7U7_9MAGN|nr:hypothetical protein IFM89_004266 [Coptis chinensis]
MATWNQQGFRDMAKSRPLFLTVYAAVLVGIVFSSFYVFSAIYGAKPIYTSNWSPSSNGDSSDRNPTHNSSRPTVLGGTSDPSSKTRESGIRPIWDIPPIGTKMPPVEAFRLTKALVKERVKHNIIIVTFGNYAFMDFILNWVKHLTDLNVSNILVGAMDTKLLEALYWKGVPVFDMGSHMSTTDAGWGSPTFHKMGREKVILIDAMLPFGYELLMCDTDMVWLKNPLPYLACFPAADVLTSTDQVVPTVVDDRLEIWHQDMIGHWHSSGEDTDQLMLSYAFVTLTGAYNIGIFHWRPTDSAKKLAKEWKEMLLADDKIWDQNGFNEIVHKQLGPSVDSESGLVYAFDGTLKLGLLPASIFCSGHTFFVQRKCSSPNEIPTEVVHWQVMYQQLQLEPYAVHTTFQYAGTEGKRHRLREGMVFFDEPEYYNSPGGFLSFKPSIPKSLLLDGEHNVKSHFTLINYQLKQIRTALAIASLLNRILVMPPLWCRLDRLWFAHPGVLEGTMTRQPFLCPLDHVFEVNVMLKGLPEEQFGPKIDFREYSFLNNPLLPKQVKESWLDVQLCQAGSDCNLSKETNQPGVLRFPKNSSEEEIRENKFRNRVKLYTGIWCCVSTHIPGHIYYDIYWDEKPGWEPVPPQTPQDDHPPW